MCRYPGDRAGPGLPLPLFLSLLSSLSLRGKTARPLSEPAFFATCFLGCCPCARRRVAPLDVSGFFAFFPVGGAGASLSAFRERFLTRASGLRGGCRSMLLFAFNGRRARTPLPSSCGSTCPIKKKPFNCRRSPCVSAQSRSCRSPLASSWRILVNFSRGKLKSLPQYGLPFPSLFLSVSDEMSRSLALTSDAKIVCCAAL